MNVLSQLCSGTEDEARSNWQENLVSLDVPFSRYRRVLYRVAYRVLDNHQEAKDAVRNCLLAASGNAPRFENEGAFRSWLVRVLIDEALAILYKERIGTTMSPEPILDLFIQGVRSQEQASSDLVSRS
jgi:DNA-directed RNA polymerase specialized sigma24 family protein